MIKEIDLNESAEDMHNKYFNFREDLSVLTIEGVFLAIKTDSQYFKDEDLKSAIKRELKRHIDTFKEDEEYYIDLMTKFIEVSK